MNTEFYTVRVGIHQCMGVVLLTTWVLGTRVHNRSRATERVLSKAEGLISPYLGSPKAEKGEQGHFNCCTSTSHGEIFCSRETTGILKENLTKQGLHLEDLLLTQAADDERSYFSSLSVNPQGQLCLSLNRPLIFATNMDEVISLGPAYGTCSNASGTSTVAGYDVSSLSTEHYEINLIHYSSQGDSIHNAYQHNSEDVSSSNSLIKEKTTCAMLTRSLNQLELNEGRSLLVLGLLRRLLEARGHLVFCHTNIPQEMKVDEPGYPMWHLLKTMLPTNFSAQTVSTPTPEEFVEVVGRLPQFIERSGRSVWFDARRFSEQLGLSGKGGYDKNLQRIQVTDGSGCLSTAAVNACGVCSANVEASHVTVYVAEQQSSFATQQSMLLRKVYNHTMLQQPQRQYLLLTSGVTCQRHTGLTNTPYPLSDLVKLRLEQMTEAYIVKYGERAKGTQLQNIATRMAEAVVKFELLSNDPSSNVKMELPELRGPEPRGAAPGHSDRDVRFSGSFVMYNYARMATLLSHFQQECAKGTYLPLPRLSDVDFSLLKEEEFLKRASELPLCVLEEWQLLFHFVLQYPSVVQEAAKLRKKGVGVHIEVALKKVCQFLIKLSHMFSSYYSRVKVLMPPEPHLLPLIHARLYLVTAIRQVMLNGLTLLAIEPIDQL